MGFIQKYEKPIALIITTLGALIAMIQGSALIIALPELIENLNANLLSLMWILISFILTTTTLVPIFGRLADKYGTRRLSFNMGFLIFTIFCLILGLAPQRKFNCWDVVIYRVGQGIGAALMFANSTPIITDLFMGGKRLALAIGVNQIAIASGFVIGPLIGGALVSVSWRWVFLFNVPIGGVGSLFGFILMRDKKKIDPSQKVKKKNNSQEFKENNNIEEISINKNDKIKNYETNGNNNLSNGNNNENNNLSNGNNNLSNGNNNENNNLSNGNNNLSNGNNNENNYLSNGNNNLSNGNNNLSNGNNNENNKTNGNSKVVIEMMEMENSKEEIFHLYTFRDYLRKYFLEGFDYLGSFLFISVMTLALTLIAEATFDELTNTTIIILSIITFFLLILFIILELNNKQPLIDIKLFRQRAFVVPVIGSFFNSFSRVLVIFGTIFFFQGPYGEDPLHAGIMIIPSGLCLLIFSFVSGGLADRLGIWPFCVLGPLIQAGGTIPLAFINQNTPYVKIAVYLAITGVGSGIYNTPNTSTIMKSVRPNQRGVAASLNIMLNNFFQMISITVIFKVMLASIPPEETLHLFAFGGGISTVLIKIFVNHYHDIIWIALGLVAVPFICTFFYDIAPYRKKKQENIKN